MTTLRAPRLSGFSAEDQATLERVAKRIGQRPDDLLQPSIFGVQTHWPAWLEANFEQSLASYFLHGSLPPIAKEGIHIAVSMANHCEY